MVASGSEAVELVNIGKSYDGGRTFAVRDFSLRVPAGEICVLVGESGCGKTTTLKLVNRLIEPTSGTIRLGDQDVLKMPAAALRRRIGYVIQDVGLLPHLTVAANVAIVPRLLRQARDETDRRVAELLELVGLDPTTYARRYPSQLSGGQQQRVGLARALAGDPPLMLMDEPFSAVDPIVRLRLREDFLRLHREIRKTVLLVTHDIDEAVMMADYVAVMRSGSLVQYSTPLELLTSPADAGVTQLIGSERGLRALALVRAGDLSLEPVVGSPRSIVAADATAREALATLLADEAQEAVVRGGDGEVLGLVTPAVIGRALRSNSEQTLAHLAEGVP